MLKIDDIIKPEMLEKAGNRHSVSGKANLPKLDTLFAVQNFPSPQFRSDDKRVRALGKALDGPMLTLRSIDDFRRVQMEDETLTPGAKQQRIAEYSRRLRNNTLDEMIALQVETVQQIDSIQRKIDEAFKPSDSVSEMRRQNIREDLAALPRKQRDDRVRNAILHNETEVIAAIATAPFSERVTIPYTYQECRELHARGAVGDNEYFALKDMETGLEALENAAKRFNDFVYEQYVNPASEIEAKAARANKEFLNEGNTNE